MTKYIDIMAAVLFTEIHGAQSVECTPICRMAHFVKISRLRYVIDRSNQIKKDHHFHASLMTEPYTCIFIQVMKTFLTKKGN